MKIALLSEKYTPDIGGLAISTERLARLFSLAGHDVRVFCPSLNLPPSEKQTLPSSGISVTRFGAHKRVDDTLVDWFELVVEGHRREPFDVLHAYFLTQAGFVATYAGKYLNIPSVVSIRGNDIDRAAFDPSKFSHVMYVLQHADAVTTNARELARRAQALVQRDIFHIPNGVEVEHFKPMDKNRVLAEMLGLASDVVLGKPTLATGEVRPTLGFVGELREKKGLKSILAAYATICQKQVVALLIVGEVRAGEDKQYFDEFRAANPTLPVRVTGYISPGSLPAYYSLIDVLVHPAVRDGMPNAVLEAMACSKAIVATGVGGISELIQAGETGVLVPANDAGALSEALLNLLEDPARRARLGNAARQRVSENYTPDKELAGNLAVYRGLGLNP